MTRRNEALSSLAKFRWVPLLALLAFPVSSFAQWNARVGSQSPDCAVGATGDVKLASGCQVIQALAFMPNEIWVHANDSITWTIPTDEVHTVTFLNQPQPAPLGVAPYPAAQQRVSGGVGCSAFGSVNTLSGSAYDPAGAAGLACVNSGVLAPYGSTYTVKFPVEGNFKFTCLIHASMNGTVHVVNAAAALPYTQRAYDGQAKAQLQNLTENLIPDSLENYGRLQVFTVGKIVGTGGGWQYGSEFRFVNSDGNVISKTAPLRVRIGQTVQFNNIDPTEPHTITFGCPTDDATCTALNPAITGGPVAFVDTSGPSGTTEDGVRYGVLNAGFDPMDGQNRDAGAKDGINAGFLIAGAQDRGTGISPLSGTPGNSVPLAQVSPALTHFRLTFNAPGQYRFICELHDDVGMIGWVNVVAND